MSNNEYMRQYMIKRYHDRMAEAREILGGKCSKCNVIDNLQIDHINRQTKSFTIGGHIWNCKKERFYEELKKCQLLCNTCHNEKTLNELGLQNVKGQNVHGTLSSYRYCKCPICKAAKAAWMKEYRRTRSSVGRAAASVKGPSISNDS